MIKRAKRFNSWVSRESVVSSSSSEVSWDEVGRESFSLWGAFFPLGRKVRRLPSLHTSSKRRSDVAERRWENCLSSWSAFCTSSRRLFSSAMLGYGKSLCFNKIRRRLKKNAAAKRSCHQRNQNPLNGVSTPSLRSQKQAANCTKSQALLWAFPSRQMIKTLEKEEIMWDNSWVETLYGESKTIECKLLIGRSQRRKSRQQDFLPKNI